MWSLRRKVGNHEGWRPQNRFERVKSYTQTYWFQKLQSEMSGAFELSPLVITAGGDGAKVIQQRKMQRPQRTEE